MVWPWKVSGPPRLRIESSGQISDPGDDVGLSLWFSLRRYVGGGALNAVERRTQAAFTFRRWRRNVDETQQRRHVPSQEAGQFGPAVRAEEPLGRSIGMWIDRSLQLTGALSDSHITALLDIARRRQAEPIDLADDDVANSTKSDD